MLTPSDKRRLRHLAENMKKELSKVQVSYLKMDCFENEDVTYTEKITRASLEQVICPLFPRIINTVVRCLNNAKLDQSKVDEILMVGGSSNLNSIQNLLQNHFKRPITKSNTNPSEAIAYGAAIQGSIIKGTYGLDPPTITDITPLALGVATETSNMCIIIKRNTNLPVTVTEKFRTEKKNQNMAQIRVYQGDSKNVLHNCLIDKFTLKNLISTKGFTQLLVTFHLNENGILKVTAKDAIRDNSKECIITMLVDFLKK